MGQADSILIQTPKSQTMLIDAGNNVDSDRVVSYSKWQTLCDIIFLRRTLWVKVRRFIRVK